jgi:uncharacterized RDD family membrane protein YckC
MSGITILDRANQPMGPFTRAQVAEKLQRGEVTLSSLAFIDGLAHWTPLRDVLARVDAAAPPPPAAVVLPPAPTPLLTAPSAPTPAYSYAATMEPPAHLVYAGFWLRVLAHLIDVVLLTVAFVVVAFVVMFVGAAPSLRFHPGGSTENNPVLMTIAFMLDIVIILSSIVGIWLYHAWLESSAWQGTVGKRLLGLRVTSMTGERISFWHASGRFFGRILGTLPFFAGYLTMLFTERKQALHDLIASTLVVRG